MKRGILWKAAWDATVYVCTVYGQPAATANISELDEQFRCRFDLNRVTFFFLLLLIFAFCCFCFVFCSLIDPPKNEHVSDWSISFAHFNPTKKIVIIDFDRFLRPCIPYQFQSHRKRLNQLKIIMINFNAYTISM